MAVLLAAAIALLGLVSFSEPATAAVGSPWDPTQATVFVSQGTPTTLYEALTNGSGTATFVAQGSAANFNYNGLAFNPVDDYLYAIAASTGTASNGAAVKVGSLIRIGQGGYTTVVGTNTFLGGGQPGNAGSFLSAGGTLYEYSTADPAHTLLAINVATGTLISSTTLSQGIVAADFTYLSGFLWSFNGTQLSRLNPSTGVLTVFSVSATNICGPASDPQSAAGAAWTYGNGNLGFSCNSTGNVIQIQVTNPSATSPTFTVVSSSSGPASTTNDGASIPGPQVDLSIAKTGPSDFVAGNQISYSLKVTNNGTGTSSGFVMTDSLPAGLTFVSASSAGCTASGSTVKCVSGTLAVGASQTFSITVQTSASMTACVTNTATVLGNETDPVSGNNSSSASSCPASVKLVKTASVATYSTTGQSITYTFTGTNTGAVTLHNVQITEGTFTGSGTMSALTCNPVQGGTIAAGGTMVCTATYTTTQTDVNAGSLANTATITGLDPLNETVTAASNVTVPATQVPAWTCSSQAYLFQTPNSTTHQIYQVDLATGKFTTFGTTSINVNAIGYNVLDNYMYGVDATTKQIVQIASDGTTTPRGDPVGFNTALSYPTGDVDPSGNLWVAGTIPNSGTWTWYEIQLSTMTILKTGTFSTLTAPSDWSYISGALYGVATGANQLVKLDPATGVYSVVGTLPNVPSGTYGGTYTDPAGDLFVSNNTTGEIYRINVSTLATIDVNTGPVSGGNDGARCASAPIATLTLTKSVDGRMNAADQFTVGLADPTGPLTSVTTSGTQTSASTTNWPVSPGTAYSITDAMAAGSPDTFASYVAVIACEDTTTGTSVTPNGTPGSWSLTPTATHDYTCTITNTGAGISIAKSVSPTTVTAANQTVTYSFLVTNIGNVTLTNVGVTETAFSGTGTLSAISCPGTTLAPAGAMTCTATYTVTQADRNAGQITNTATSHGTTPSGSVVVSTPSSARVLIPKQATVLPLPLTGGVGTDTYLIAGGLLTGLSVGLGGLQWWRRRRP